MSDLLVINGENQTYVNVHRKVYHYTLSFLKRDSDVPQQSGIDHGHWPLNLDILDILDAPYTANFVYNYIKSWFMVDGKCIYIYL